MHLVSRQHMVHQHSTAQYSTAQHAQQSAALVHVQYCRLAAMAKSTTAMGKVQIWQLLPLANRSWTGYHSIMLNMTAHSVTYKLQDGCQNPFSQIAA